jgi:hypothetical protein
MLNTSLGMLVGLQELAGAARNMRNRRVIPDIRVLYRDGRIYYYVIAKALQFSSAHLVFKLMYGRS